MTSSTSLICNDAYLARLLFSVCTAITKEEKKEKLFLILDCKGKHGLHVCSKKSVGRLELHNECRLSNCLTNHGGGGLL